MQVHHALRAGKAEEAAAAADSFRLALPGLQQVAEHLRSWLQRWRDERSLPEHTTRSIAQYAQAALDTGELARCSAATARSVLVTLSVLCGSATPLDTAVAGQVPALAQGGHASVEDWLWFHCSLACAQMPSGVCRQARVLSLHQQ